MNVEQFYIISATHVIVSAMLNLALTIFTWRCRNIVDIRYFFWFMVTVTAWDLAAVLSFISSTTEVAAYWVGKVNFLGVATLPVAFLAFAFNFTGRTSWLKPRNFVLLSAIPAVTQVMAWTNSPLFITDRVHQRFGPYLIDVSHVRHEWFWVHTAYSYSLLAIGFILLVLFAIRSRYPYRALAMISIRI
jgi:hypothetical protein